MVNQKMLATFLLLIFLFALSACSPTPATGESLVGTRWYLVSMGKPGQETPVVDNSEVTLEFQAGGQAGGSSGCNSYGGQYQVQGDGISFSEIVSTLIDCADESVMSQEKAYLQILQSAGRVEILGDQLKIFDADGAQVLNFKRLGTE